MRAIFLAILVVAVSAQAQDMPANKPSVLSTPSGRFVFGQIGQSRADQYMLDTATGRLWRIVIDDKGHAILQNVDYIMVNGLYSMNAPEADYEIQQLRLSKSQKADEKPAEKK